MVAFIITRSINNNGFVLEANDQLQFFFYYYFHKPQKKITLFFISPWSLTFLWKIVLKKKSGFHGEHLPTHNVKKNKCAKTKFIFRCPQRTRSVVREGEKTLKKFPNEQDTREQKKIGIGIPPSPPVKKNWRPRRLFFCTQHTLSLSLWLILQLFQQGKKVSFWAEGKGRWSIKRNQKKKKRSRHNVWFFLNLRIFFLYCSLQHLISFFLTVNPLLFSYNSQHINTEVLLE